jgi:DNA (cytosine-5)-methyltransferase 1
MIIRYIELFCGVGGFRYGLETCNRQQQEDTEIGRRKDSIIIKREQPNQSKKRGNDISRTNSKDSPNNESRTSQHGKCSFHCVYANEIDHWASAIYRSHWNDGTLCEGDIRTVDASAIPKHDLLCAGFPCQSFSIAGKRGGFEDTRGTLFFEICRVLRVKRTKYVFLENVKGLLSHDDGYTFQTIIGTLDELGYDCQWQVLNSKDYRVPQNRERVFIIGYLRNISKPQVFPLGELSGENDGKQEPNEATSIRCLGDTARNQGNMTIIRNSLLNLPQAQRVRSIDGVASTLQGNAGGQGGKTGLYSIPIAIRTREKGYKEVEPKQDGIANSLTGVKTDSMLEISNAIDPDGYLRSGARPRDENGKPQLLPIGHRRIRRLTPIECERLQAFPDNFTKYGLTKEGKQIEISDTQRYKVMGNAVTTSVITAIGKQLAKSLEETSQNETPNIL